MNKDTQPYAFRRHLRACEHFGPGGREVRSDKCDCPFHVDGKHHGSGFELLRGESSSQDLADHWQVDAAARINGYRLVGNFFDTGGAYHDLVTWAQGVDARDTSRGRAGGHCDRIGAMAGIWL